MKVVLSLIVCFGLASGQTSKVPPIKFTDTTLENGLRVIISEDHYAPVFGIAVVYKVGSRDERPGAPGSRTCSST